MLASIIVWNNHRKMNDGSAKGVIGFTIVARVLRCVRRAAGDRRTNDVWSTGRNLTYGYDRAHQLTDVISPSRASDRASYRYDKAGNPIRRTEMGFGVTNSFNNLNQIVSGIWTGGAITVVGAVNYAVGTVTVAGVTGKIYPDRTFDATNVAVTMGTNVLTAIYHGPAFTNTQMVATDKVTVIVGNAAYTHDGNGNLTGDQNFTYQYDLANRLTNVISKASGSSVLAARYDGLGRRIEVTRNGTTVERYVYFPGSFLVLAVLDGSNVVKEIYTHGPDLSGTIGGAGGIGGILSVSTNIGAASASKYFHADAMGNVILVSDSDGKQVASYGFTPFGKLVKQVGDYKARFLFSFKEQEAETSIVNFGLRYFSTARGAWLTRDILGESMQVNLYAFVGNRPLAEADPIGLVGEGIISLAEIPGVGSQLNALHARLIEKAVKVSPAKVTKAEFTHWLAKVGPEVFVTLYAQAIYDVLQARLEDVVRNIGVCHVVNIQAASSSSERGEISVKEHAFPALTQPWTWSTAPTVTRAMKYEPCPDGCYWRVFFYVPTSKDLTTWKEVERFSCSGSTRCRKTH